MAISVLPAATISTVNGQAYKVPAKGTKHKLTGTFKAGVYTISCATSTIATVTFQVGSTFTNAVTSSGTVTFNLASDADAVYVSINTGTDIVVSITKTAESVPGAAISGTLDTITATGTYSTTGNLYVVCIGGGAGGGQGQSSNGYPAGGGGSGGIDSGFVVTTSSTSVTVGAVAAGNVEPQNTGGTTSFGAFFSATGGQSGRNGDYAGDGGAAGSPNGSAGTSGDVNGNNTAASINQQVVIGSQTQNVSGGTGGAKSVGNSGTPGGNGGKGGTASAAAIAATGYGGGGGGGSSPDNRTGSAGTAGVIYVLRNF